MIKAWKEGRSLHYFLQLISESHYFTRRVSYALRACKGVILSPDTRGMEIVTAVVTLDNFIQFNSVHFLTPLLLFDSKDPLTSDSTNDEPVCQCA